MLIRLEHNGANLFEIDSQKIDKDIEIGRSHHCTWSIAADEKLLSSHHAKLMRKGRSCWVEDLGSSNGTFCRGKKIKKKKLKAGDRISMGGCTLTVEAGNGETEAVEVVPEIVVLSGKTRGQKKEVRHPKFTIGSDPSSSLVLLDMLVSRHHAEIMVKEDGSCWIKDLGSKNGTSVNAMPLRQNQERLLKEGDRISMAHMEMCFHDGLTKRSSVKVWVRLGIMLGTLVVVTSLYWGYQRMKPSATSYLQQARDRAAEEDFTGAQKALDMAEGARNMAAHRLELEDLNRLIMLWGNTLKTWQTAQENLEQGDWVNASRNLGDLYSRKNDAWTWSPSAVDEKNAVLRSKGMLDVLLHASGALKTEESQFSLLEQELANVKKALAEGESGVPDYLSKARTELLDMQARLESFIAESRELEQALDSLTGWPPPIDNVVKVMEDTYNSSRGVLKRKCELMLDPVKVLGQSMKQLDRAIQLAREMKFNDMVQIDLSLPSTSACALDSRVSTARANIESMFDKMKIQVNQLNYLFREVNKLVPVLDDTIPAQIKAWDDAVALDRVFACDSLDRPMPRRSRKEASGEYDRFLGIEDFYDFLMALTLRQRWNEKPTTPFMTTLFQAEGIVSSVDSIRSFFEKEDWATQLTPVNVSFERTKIVTFDSSQEKKETKKTISKETAWLLEGSLAKQVDDLRGILVARDALVEKMLGMAANSTGRKAIIAAGVAYRLATDPSKLKIGDKELEAWIVERMEAMRADLRKLGQEYDLANPGRQIEIREQVLQVGIPGDPVVRRMWTSRTATQGM